MKLKLRFDADDMKRFLLVCLLLLYIVAIAISNLSSVTSTGEFTGFNPLPAFSMDLIGSTILFYIVSVVALMVSTKSYFFEFEKGFGFTTDKKLDGYSKWAEAKDMKKELKMIRPTDAKTEYAGIALINDGKKIWVDDGDYHNLIIGSTGSGKTQNIIFPMIEILAKHGESMIITDPKGELYEKKSNMLRSKGYNIVVLNFRDPGRGNAWNPMTLPYNLYRSGNRDKAMELLDDLALNILYDEGNKNADPFWEKTSADYFSGLSLGLFDDAKESEINLNSISLMTTVGEEKMGGSTYIKEYFNLKDPGSSAYINASSTILAPSDTKMSILAVFKQKIKLFASRENLSEMLSYSDFDISEIGRKKTAVFIIVQDEKKTYHSLVTIFIKQVYETLIDVAQSSPGNKLPVRTNFYLMSLRICHLLKMLQR
ncbi:MAG: type IV secretory system conjugative DNA transfer family protein [Bacilli bacterium]|nr:type IV secretory system conjugative DNA transfer family protein [Bacilli bacterium]